MEWDGMGRAKVPVPWGEGFYTVSSRIRCHLFAVCFFASQNHSPCRCYLTSFVGLLVGMDLNDVYSKTGVK